MNKKFKAALAGLAFVAGCEIGIAIQLMKMIHKFTIRESASNTDADYPDEAEIDVTMDEADGEVSDEAVTAKYQMKPTRKLMKRQAQLLMKTRHLSSLLMSLPTRSMMKLSKPASPLQKLPNREKRQNRHLNTKQPIKERRTCHVL